MPTSPPTGRAQSPPVPGERPRVVALAVLVRPLDGSLLVQPGRDEVSGEEFHRLIGGGVSFGESASQTVRRELLEEYSLAVRVHERLLVAENIFTYQGRQGHELAIAFRCTPDDPGLFAKPSIPATEPGLPPARWRSVDSAVALYPADVAAAWRSLLPAF